MPKSRPPRKARRRGRKPQPAPVAPQAARPVVAPIAMAPPEERAREQARPVGRVITRDYSYVGRDLRRILVLATVILITIVVISFFLP